MLQKIKQISENTIIRYLFIGGVSYLIEIGVLFYLSHILHQPPVLSVGLSFWIGLIVSFILQKVLTFRNKKSSTHLLLWQSFSYGILIVINYLFTLTFVALFSALLGLIVARTLALIITTCWNYLVYSKIIFTNEPSRTYYVARRVIKYLYRHLPKLLLVISVALLIVSSIYVGYKSSIAQSNNHDQLIDSFLLESPNTFQYSVFPGAHSQLMKWPIFAVTALFGNSSPVFIITTTIVYVLTVTLFGLLIFRFTKRNKLITSLVLLCLTSTLMLIPVQPSPGALLPVNMAMLTTRNLEYILFILLIATIISSRKLLSWSSVLIVLGLIVLGASDKLFAVLSVLISIVMLLAKIALSRQFNWRKDLDILTITFLGYIGSTLILNLINLIGITSIAGAGTSSPYGIVTSLSEITEGLKQGVRALLINFGALPQNQTSLMSYIFPIFNGIILAVVIIACLYSVITWVQHTTKRQPVQKQLEFTVWLIAGSVITMAMFVLTKHEYQSDARYIGLIFFAGFFALTYYLTSLSTPHKKRYLIVSSMVLLLCIPPTFMLAKENLNHTIYATNIAIGNRMDVAAEILKKENVSVLVGDYWFTVPTRLKTNNSTLAVPQDTSSCDTLNPILNSTVWQEPSQSTIKSALYMLRDAGENSTTFNHGCTINDLNKKYGPYSEQFIIRGDKEKPIDIIRIYSYDIRKNL